MCKRFHLLHTGHQDLWFLSHTCSSDSSDWSHCTTSRVFTVWLWNVCMETVVEPFWNRMHRLCLNAARTSKFGTRALPLVWSGSKLAFTPHFVRRTFLIYRFKLKKFCLKSWKPSGGILKNKWRRRWNQYWTSSQTHLLSNAGQITVLVFV